MDDSSESLPSEPDLVAVYPDGKRSPVAEGEFRSLDGKLLFVRKGDRIEIRCPRSKGLYVLEWESTPSSD